MRTFTLIVVGITSFLIGAMWLASSGEAVQPPNIQTINLRELADNSLQFADTVHINTNEVTGASETETDAKDTRETLFKEIKKLNQTVYDIKNRYMEEIDTQDLIKAGIRGMLKDLDRFSVLMERKSYERLMESTSGKYEGLGMEIDSRGDYISVVTPMEGTPAYRIGLRPGDEIRKIDGINTLGMTTSDAASHMRGTAGTSVVLTIMRTGFAEAIDFEVERAVIELKSVNYYGTVNGDSNIGYIRLSRFAEETGNELRAAIDDLNKQGVDALIFDLRSNGGGLLTQAVETAELFIEENNLVVYTRGKYAGSERHHYSQRAPLFPEKPLVILTNEGTASASEIVAGAIQDWDRGVIMGYPTYGKGLVQQVFPIGNDDDIALKLTTAKYYVPSGRCIQKPETQEKYHPETAGNDDDADENADSLKVVEKEIFYTNNGRPVYGGGGILPDVELEDEDYLNPLEINLERGRYFFDFAVKYVGESDIKSADFEVSDNIVEDFRIFTDEKEFKYKTSLEVALEEMKEIIEEDGTDSLYSSAVGNFENLVIEEKRAEFTKSSDYIKKALRREIISNLYGERGVYENIILKTDKAVLEAIELLSDQGKYMTALEKGHTERTALDD